MKKFSALILAVVLLTGILPQTAMAVQDASLEQELTTYLNEVSEIRGFEVTKEDIGASLSSYGESFDSFASVEELRSYLGDVIKSDLSNLGFLYEAYSMDEAAVADLLAENGGDFDNYIYTGDLFEAIAFYGSSDVREADFDLKLIEFLSAAGATRGFEVTKEKVEAFLNEYGFRIADFNTVAEFKYFLGDVINADLSNLDYFDDYNTEGQSIFQVIEDNGKSINDFVFIGELESFLWANSEVSFPEPDMAEIMSYLNMLGITEEEMNQLYSHFMSLEDLFTNPEVLTQIEGLAERAMIIAEQVGAAEPTKEQLEELIAIYNEYLTIFKLRLNAVLIVDGTEIPVEMSEIMSITDPEGIDGFRIEFYSTDNVLLADMEVTSDLLESGFGGLLTGAMDNINEETEEVSEELAADNTESPRTVKGATLPKTASDYIPNALIGMAIALTGAYLYKKVKHVKDESTEE